MNYFFSSSTPEGATSPKEGSTALPPDTVTPPCTPVAPGEAVSYPEVRSGGEVLDAKHMAAFHDLRSRVTDLLPLLPTDPNSVTEDDILHRFLIARDTNVEEAESAVRSATLWRENERPHLYKYDLFDKFGEDIQGFFECALYGHDVDGYPVYWQAPNPDKINALIKDHGLDWANKLNLYVAERCREMAKKQGVDRFTVVVDMQHIGPSVMFSDALEMMKGQMKTSCNTYPECMMRCLIYNPPWVFEAIFSMLKPLLDDRIRAKVLVGNTFLASIVTPGNTPPQFGGTAAIEWEAISIRLTTGDVWELKCAGKEDAGEDVVGRGRSRGVAMEEKETEDDKEEEKEEEEG